MAGEALSPLEQDVVKNNERNFRETLGTIAQHSSEVVAVEAERGDGEPETDFLFVLAEGTHTPETLHDMEINLGLDSSVKAIVTTDGSAVIVQAGISPGRVGEVFTQEAEVNPMLKSALDDLLAEQQERTQRVNLDSLSQVTDTIRASLGKTYAGEAQA